MQKIPKTKLPQILKTTFLLTFVLVEFFGLWGNNKAQATANACGFVISFGADSPVQLNQPLVFHVQIKNNQGGPALLGCLSSQMTLVIWDTNMSNTGGYTVPALTYCYIPFFKTQTGTYTLSDCAQSTQVLVSDKYYKAGYTFNLHAGVYAGVLNAPIDPSSVSFDTEATPVSVSVAGNSSGQTCQNDAGCKNASSNPNGYICNQGQCVEDAELPAGSHCVINASLEDCDMSKGLSCNPSSNTCTAAQTSTLYGCLSAGTGGVFTCAATQADPGIAACTSNGGIISIPSANCGCTQAEVSSGVTGKNCKQNGGTGSATPPAGGQTSNSATVLFNPITGQDNLAKLLVNIMKAFLGMIGVWAVAFIVFGGFKMVISSGNEEAVLSARKTITWAILGLLVAVLSFAIIAIVQDLIGVTVQQTPQTTSSIINITRDET